MARHDVKQQGATLVAVLMALLTVAMSVIALVAQQIGHQHELVSMEFRRLERQLAIESSFQRLADNNHIEMDPWQGIGELSNGPSPATTDLHQLQTEREHAPCPHPFANSSKCWRLRVRQASTGFVRERLLVEPAPQCAKPYWFAPAARVGSHLDFNPVPEPTPPQPPVRPPRDGRLSVNTH